jgi:hypothetical protein
VPLMASEMCVAYHQSTAALVVRTWARPHEQGVRVRLELGASVLDAEERAS